MKVFNLANVIPLEGCPLGDLPFFAFGLKMMGHKLGIVCFLLYLCITANGRMPHDK